MKIKVIFWDIDGTLTDDQIHKVKHRLLAKAANYEISEFEGMQLNGVADDKTYAYLCNKSVTFQDFYPSVEAYLTACHDFFVCHAAKPDSEYRVKDRQGAITLLHELANLGIEQACVTSAPDWQANANIAALNVSNTMRFIQMLDVGIQPKPSPDLYEFAFNKMVTYFPDLQKSEILVIEDSLSGVSAAQAAGLQVIHCRMAETAPASDKTIYHAFTFAQVYKIMIERFGIPLSSVLEAKVTASQHQLSTARNTMWAEKHGSTESNDYGLKQFSGNIHQWPYIPTKDSSARIDELRPNRVKYS